MGARKGLLFAIVVAGSVFSQISIVQATVVTLEAPFAFDYDYKSDPFLLEWTFSFEDKSKQVATPVAEELASASQLIVRSAGHTITGLVVS
jgi:hypothetical protein